MNSPRKLAFYVLVFISGCADLRLTSVPRNTTSARELQTYSSDSDSIGERCTTRFETIKKETETEKRAISRAELEEVAECYRKATEINEEGLSHFYDLAELLKRMDLCVQAFEIYERIAHGSKRNPQVVPLAERMYLATKGRCPKLRITLAHEDQDRGNIVVKVNGIIKEESVWRGASFFVDAGQNIITITAPGYQSSEYSENVKWDRTVLRKSKEQWEKDKETFFKEYTHEIKLKPLEPIVPPPPPPQRWWALGFGIAGGVALASGIVLTAVEASIWNDAISACNPPVQSMETACKSEDHRRNAAEIGDEARRLGYGAVTAFSAAAISGGIGLYLWATLPKPFYPINANEFKIHPFVIGSSDWGFGLSGKF